MLTVIYDAYEGLHFPDGVARNQAIEFWNNRDNQPEVVVSSSLMIDCFRLLISQGVIPIDEFTFSFNGKTLDCDSGGCVHNWPEGFADAPEGILRELLLLMAGKVTLSERATNLADVVVDKELDVPTEITEMVGKVLGEGNFNGNFFVPCIKELRNRFGTTLKSSKMFVDIHRDDIIAEIESQSDDYHYNQSQERFFRNEK